MNNFPSDLPSYLHRRLARRRKRLGLHRVQLGKRASVSHQRISDYEGNRRPPDGNSLERLSAALGTTMHWLTSGTDWLPQRARTPWKRGEHEILRKFRSHAVYRVPVDRPALVRLLQSVRRYKDLARSLVRQIRARKWGWPILCWLVHMPMDSDLEALFDLRAFASDACPVNLSVQSVGFVHKPVVHPETLEIVGHHPVPGFVLKLGKLECLFFPQVTLQCSKPHTVDFLVKVRWNKQSVWVVLEIDGALHRGDLDDERAVDLGLSVVRLDESEIKSPECLLTLEQKLAKKHPQHPL